MSDGSSLSNVQNACLLEEKVAQISGKNAHLHFSDSLSHLLPATQKPSVKALSFSSPTFRRLSSPALATFKYKPRSGKKKEKKEKTQTN